MKKTNSKLIVVSNEMTVFDGDKQDFVKVSKEQQLSAGYIHQQIAMGVFITALAIKKMYDEKLYLAFNCSTREEYADTMLPFGRRQAEKYYRIADKFKEYLPENANLSSQIEGDVQELGIAKLYELTKIEDEDLRTVMSGGNLTGADGNKYSLEDINDMSARELSKRIQEIKSKYTSRISNFEEENKLLKAERESDKELVESAKEQTEHAHKLEIMYGGGASLLKDKEACLQAARDHFRRAWESLESANITEKDPVQLQREVPEILNGYLELHHHLCARYSPFIDMREAYGADNAKLKK